MKKANITLKMEAQSLEATKRYMEKKDVSIEQELGEALQKLYEKHVPAAVREYIDETAENLPSPKSKNQKKKNANNQTEELIKDMA